MAKRNPFAMVRSAPPVVVMAPRSRARRAISRVGHAARKVARSRHVRKALPTFGVAAGGLLLGYLDGSGHLDALPAIMGSRMVTLGVLGYAATRFTKNPHARAAGLAALGAAAYDFGKEAAHKK